MNWTESYPDCLKLQPYWTAQDWKSALPLVPASEIQRHYDRLWWRLLDSTQHSSWSDWTRLEMVTMVINFDRSISCLIALFPGKDECELLYRQARLRYVWDCL